MLGEGRHPSNRRTFQRGRDGPHRGEREYKSPATLIGEAAWFPAWNGAGGLGCRMEVGEIKPQAVKPGYFPPAHSFPLNHEQPILERLNSFVGLDCSR